MMGRMMGTKEKRPERGVFIDALAERVSAGFELHSVCGDLFEKRARMMAEWAKFCDTITPVGEVVPIRGKTAA